MAQTITIKVTHAVTAMWHCSAVAGLGCSNSLGEQVM